MKTKTKSAKPAFGTPEFRKKYAGKGKKRKGPTWRKKMHAEVRTMARLVKKMAKAQGIKVPSAAKKVAKRRRR